jgi:hypothetical protein
VLDTIYYTFFHFFIFFNNNSHQNILIFFTFYITLIIFYYYSNKKFIKIQNFSTFLYKFLLLYITSSFLINFKINNPTTLFCICLCQTTPIFFVIIWAYLFRDGTEQHSAVTVHVIFFFLSLFIFSTTNQHQNILTFFTFYITSIIFITIQIKKFTIIQNFFTFLYNFFILFYFISHHHFILISKLTTHYSVLFYSVHVFAKQAQ